jgi:hypothetical protein
MKRILCVAVSLTVMMVALLTVLPSFVQAATIKVEAFIDGRSQLILRGNTAQWQHFDYSAPGVPESDNYPTIINSANWTPSWTGNPNNCDGCFSNIFSGVCPGLSASEQTVNLNVIQARDSVSIVQQPSLINNYTLIVEFDDNGPGGAAWYIIELDFPSSQACPAVPAVNEWGMIIFTTLAGLGAFYFLRIQRKVQA